DTNPKKDVTDSTTNKILGWVATGLEGASFLPIVGEPASLLLAGIDTAQGDYKGAALNLAAAVVGIGTGGMGKEAVVGTAKGGKFLMEMVEDESHVKPINLADKYPTNNCATEECVTVLGKRPDNLQKNKNAPKNDLSHLTEEQQQTSNPKPDFDVENGGDSFNLGQEFKNGDPRFPNDAGFSKIQRTHKLPNGDNISIHYQYNSNTNAAYDMKIDTPQRNVPSADEIFNSLKGKLK
ncbi:hypothetical protein PT283_10210, partial [Acetobacteraceae bacterium ESL0697]|nr:hypothetical protein [Acetobacteraceae bacterium ESL0697]